MSKPRVVVWVEKPVATSTAYLEPSVAHSVPPKTQTRPRRYPLALVACYLSTIVVKHCCLLIRARYWGYEKLVT